jgi:predicted ester cyclase
MSQTHHDFVVRWFEEVWNKGREETIEELSQPDAQCFGFPQPDSVLNREEFKACVREFRRTFSHIHIKVEESVSEGYRVAVRWSGSMKHTGAGLGFAPTGHTVTIIGMSLLHLRDGLISKGWNALDLNNAVAHLSAVSARP